MSRAIDNVYPAPPAFAFEQRLPAIRTVQSGSLLRVHAIADGYEAALRASVDDWSLGLTAFNALTGPIAVEGAEPGDAVAVHIVAIDVADHGFVIYVDRWGAQSFRMRRSWITRVEIAGPLIELAGVGRIPVRPMVGCIGVAPERNALSSLGPTGRTGGNLDLREVAPGATVWLPVEVPGGLLSLGDLHAAMGAGEPAGAGIECAGAVTIVVDLVKARPLEGPRIETADDLLFVGTDPHDFFAAKSAALRGAWQFIHGERGLDERSAFALCSAALEIRAGGPAGINVVAGFSKRTLMDAEVGASF